MRYFKTAGKTVLFVFYIALSANAYIFAEAQGQNDVDTVMSQISANGDEEDALLRVSIGTLSPGGDRGITFRNLPNERYEVVAVCDNDCTDIDLCVSTDSDSEKSCDDDSTSLAITYINVTEGKLTADVDMHECGSNFCYYGVGVYVDR